MTPLSEWRDAARDRTMNRRVEQAIARRACGYKVALKKTYKVKRVEYDPDTGKKVAEVETLALGTDEVHVPADLRAGAYWLNNRDPLHWQDDPDGTDRAAVTLPESAEGEALSGVVEIAAVSTPERPPEGESV